MTPTTAVPRRLRRSPTTPAGRPRSAMERARPAASTVWPASRGTSPTSFTMWFREQGHVFDWGTLKWCQAYTTPPNGCYDAENIALDEFGHVEGLGHHDNYDVGLGLRRCRRPDLLANQTLRWLEQARLRTVRCRPAPDHLRPRHGIEQVLDVPRPVDRPDDRRLADADRGRRIDDADRDAQGRRCRRLRPAGRQRRVGADGHPPASAPSARRPGPASERWRSGPSPAPTCSPSGRAARPSTEPSSRRPSTEGINGDSSPAVRVNVTGCGAGAVAKSESPTQVPCA